MAPPLLSALIGRLRFKHLRLVDALARGGNLHRVAAEMHMTQPAASKILKDAELILGAPLFERRPRGMVPTEIGGFAADYAARMLRAAESFTDGMDNLKAGGFGALSIGAIMATTPGLLPRAIAELKQRRPLMTIRLLAATSDILLAALSRDEIALAVGRLTQPEDALAFHIEPLASEELWIFAAADHPLARRPAITLGETARLAWVLQPKGSPMRRLLDRTFAEQGVGSLDNCVETTSIFATLHLVREAGMIACLPKSILVEGVTSGTFSRLPIELTHDLGPLGIITRRGETPSANAADFIDVLRTMRTLPPSLA
ncbi:LysR family transcriptional regulator [Ancylobacter pratisalsi]|uniref:LysR family transcriptional regulator n=1 Tax=Ancylobacter pratisalsi TaxID=1745854 RepID=A0A6P1YLQ8_9HYPH|nr:LysR family transcriptional regulator [Ancylobacter pratisalsi]QIB33621.1 LysR family transcriptional regulator [Ancylobacter pratisalsi]